MSTTSLNFRLPNSIVAGDYLSAHICFVAASFSTAASAPTGWNTYSSQGQPRIIQINGNVSDQMFFKTAVAGDRNSTVTFTVTDPVATVTASGVVLVISNTTGEDDYKAFALTGNPLAATPGALNSTPTYAVSAGELVLLAMLVYGQATLAAPAGWTQIRALASAQVSLLFAYLSATAAGSQPFFTISLPSSMDSFCAEISYLGATSALRAFVTA